MGNDTAYIVIVINKKATPPVVVSCGVFSERSPSMMYLGTYQTAVIAEIKDVDYHNASRAAKRWLNEPHNAWLKDLYVRGQV